MAILVTGGAGYVGTHTCVVLLQAGHDVVVIDDLSNSKSEAIARVEKLTGKKIAFYQGSILDRQCLADIFDKHDIDSVIHFSGFKAVGESVFQPWKYYYNNVAGSLILLDMMNKAQVKKIVFSSSATVYGDTQTMPLVETMATSAKSPYGQTKLMIEQILRDIAFADQDFRVSMLRYFNPIGAHPSGMIGEDPFDIPNNLMPFITQVACGRRPLLSVYGDDYPTKDGTGVRDYIHVMDLAKGHLAALQHLESQTNNLEAYNLGTGIGYSVLEVINTFEAVNNLKINYMITKRRPGDVAVCYSDVAKAKRELGWQAELSLEDMCRDSYNWQSKNPNGY